MDPVSSVSALSEDVTQKAKEKAKESHRQLKDILNDPKQTIVFMIVTAVVIAVLFIVYNTVSDLISTGEGVKELQKSNQRVVAEEEEQDFDKIRRQEIDTINSAVKNYFAKNKKYPQSLSTMVPNYLFEVPRDPATNQIYSYRVGLDYMSYEVWSVLENGQVYSLRSP